MGLELYLDDTQYKYEYIDHDREIVRAIVIDNNGFFYFVGADRDDDFGKAILIETAGGGVEHGENYESAIRRELQEELGVNVDVLCKLGMVSDYYNLIHRHNINNYYLCRVTSFTNRSLTFDEENKFHLSVLKVSYEEAVNKYKESMKYKLGVLIRNRELPILEYAKRLIDQGI